MFMSASNDNGHIYVEIKLSRRRRQTQRGHPLPTQTEFAVNFYFCLNIFYGGYDSIIRNIFKHAFKTHLIMQKCLQNVLWMQIMLPV